MIIEGKDSYNNINSIFNSNISFWKSNSIRSNSSDSKFSDYSFNKDIEFFKSSSGDSNIKKLLKSKKSKKKTKKSKLS